MNVNQSYDAWSVYYDTNHNKTRDLEAISLRETLHDIAISNCLEIGCGTGKNTVWLAARADNVLAVDLSDQMLLRAKEKINADNVNFQRADITSAWEFANDKRFDLVSFSLVLEHIEDLEGIFEKLDKVIEPGGHVYIGELHPFKQYNGSKARFETENGVQVVTCFNHHVSDFTNAAARYGFKLELLKEYFDDNNRIEIPRILTLLFRK